MFVLKILVRDDFGFEPVVHAEGFKADHVDRQIPKKTRGASAATHEPDKIVVGNAVVKDNDPGLFSDASAPAAGEAQGSDKTPPADPEPTPTQNNAQAPDPGAKEQAPPGPTNEDEYAAHARAWFPACKDATEAHARWKSESKLRRACKVSGQTMEDLQDELDRTEFAG